MADAPDLEPAAGSTRGSTASAVAAGGDERLAYRSIFQRLFVRPEIGALIGAVGIWSFFWSVSATFGTAGQTFGWLDIAATLGIMAVAVSMLMIGGEFDLSSGAMTGAMGMLIILMVKDTGDLGGLGVPLVIAIPLSLAFALGIGYMNGYMVERTGQPSFIITLATFFALKGLKLGLAKRFVDQIQVGRTDEASDFGFFRPIFAAEWSRNEHELEIRDFLYTTLLALGLVVLVLAILELWFQRNDARKPAGLIGFVIGAALGVGGGIALHSTDGVGANAAIFALIAVGTIVALVGWAHWRYVPVVDRGSFHAEARTTRRMAIGIALVVVGCAVAILIDSASTNEIFFPFTTQGVRVILFAVLVVAGLTVLAMASQAALSHSPTTKFVATCALAVGCRHRRGNDLRRFERGEVQRPAVRSRRFRCRDLGRLGRDRVAIRRAAAFRSPRRSPGQPDADPRVAARTRRRRRPHDVHHRRPNSPRRFPRRRRRSGCCGSCCSPSPWSGCWRARDSAAGPSRWVATKKLPARSVCPRHGPRRDCSCSSRSRRGWSAC